MEYNATSSNLNAVSSMASMPGWLPIIIIFVLGSLICVFLLNEKTMKQLLKFVVFMERTFGNFVYGLFGVIIFGGTYYFIKWNTNQIKEGNPYFLKWTGIIIISYFIISAFGWVIKKFVYKVRTTHNKAQKQIKKRRVK